VPWSPFGDAIGAPFPTLCIAAVALRIDILCVRLGAQAAKAAAASKRRASVAGTVSGAGSDTARGGPLPSARGRRESTVGGGLAASVGSRR
jgi:hypothetical protein